MAFLLAASIAGCDCTECGGPLLEVIDAHTGKVVEGALVAYAESIYAPRTRAEGTLPPGEFKVWVRAEGYRNWYGEVEIPVECADEETGTCPDRVITIEVTRR